MLHGNGYDNGKRIRNGYGKRQNSKIQDTDTAEIRSQIPLKKHTRATDSELLIHEIDRWLGLLSIDHLLLLLFLHRYYNGFCIGVDDVVHQGQNRNVLLLSFGIDPVGGGGLWLFGDDHWFLKMRVDVHQRKFEVKLFEECQKQYAEKGMKAKEVEKQRELTRPKYVVCFVVEEECQLDHKYYLVRANTKTESHIRQVRATTVTRVSTYRTLKIPETSPKLLRNFPETPPILQQKRFGGSRNVSRRFGRVSVSKLYRIRELLPYRRFYASELVKKTDPLFHSDDVVFGTIEAVMIDIVSGHWVKLKPVSWRGNPNGVCSHGGVSDPLLSDSRSADLRGRLLEHLPGKCLPPMIVSRNQPPTFILVDDDVVVWKDIEPNGRFDSPMGYPSLEIENEMAVQLPDELIVQILSMLIVASKIASSIAGRFAKLG
ncbi:hypothetical protein OSB04_013104 [Centaurea solstitialis]|uniref:Uncharacterized protein n=1 Tax=Centaurea solstitialis TaxID=347529 RepID=A0AA38TPC1_9ASTR|nr:hypothetical protein OSB04_013104 [Centaurea solstitialis]